jgi:hypothetical protein
MLEYEGAEKNVVHPASPDRRCFDVHAGDQGFQEKVSGMQT